MEGVRKSESTVVASPSRCGTAKARTKSWCSEGATPTPEAQASPAVSTRDIFGSAYSTPYSRVVEGNELPGIDAAAEEKEWVSVLTEDVLRQVPTRVAPLRISLSRRLVSSTSPPSSRPAGGKNMEVLLAASQKEEEERGKRLAKRRRRSKRIEQNSESGKTF